MSVSHVVSPTGTADESGEHILRYTLGERINHWIAGFSYVYCLITGLGFWSPYMYWLTIVVGGGPTARFWHPWFGLAFCASAFWMYKVWRNDMITNDADRAWRRTVKHYIRNEDEKLPPIDRFNYGQKAFFWLMFYGAILLVLSGVVLWFSELIPWSLHWLRYLAVTVHVTAALATIGGFIIHVYMGTAMVRGGFASVIRGEVSADWARTHHRLWYERITGRRERR
jgi:formate dehydrogenase subunit gamma